MQIPFGSVKILLGLKYYNLVHPSGVNSVFHITNSFVRFPPYLHNTAVTDAYNVVTWGLNRFMFQSSVRSQ